jgi:hypothetical protein
MPFYNFVDQQIWSVIRRLVGIWTEKLLGQFSQLLAECWRLDARWHELHKVGTKSKCHSLLGFHFATFECNGLFLFKSLTNRLIHRWCDVVLRPGLRRWLMANHSNPLPTSGMDGRWQGGLPKVGTNNIWVFSLSVGVYFATVPFFLQSKMR